MGPSEGNNVAPSLLLRGLRPLGRQQNALPCHPLTTRGRCPPSHTLPRGGSMHQTPRKFGRAQTTDPAEFSWCRARDLNPHGKPIRPSSVRVCQFRQPGTDSRDHYTAPIRSPARPQERKCYQSDARSDGNEDVGTQRPSPQRGETEQGDEDGQPVADGNPGEQHPGSQNRPDGSRVSALHESLYIPILSVSAQR